MRRSIVRATLATILLAAAPASAQPPDASAIAVVAPWARPTPGTATTGAAYMTLRNAGTDGDRLVAVATPVAANAELHTVMRDGDVMRMRPVDGIAIGPHGTAELKPGGVHVMLIGLKEPLRAGTRFPLTLTFEKAGERTIEVTVRGAAGKDGGHRH